MLDNDLFMSPYNPSWEEGFIEGSQRLKEVIGDYIVRIHHIGSTSVPGLCAKPIIDMIPEVRSFNDRKKWIPILIENGYRYIDKWNDIMPFRRLFARYENNDYSSKVLEHIHIVEKNHSFVERHLLFRDYLRKSEIDRIAYCEMKQELINSGIPRKDYNEMKTEFIQSIDRKAYMWKHGEELPANYYKDN
ncbi:MAG: GrpB family protein [Candidatus Kariarchaeaceae archaeon]|jgi:GrpB-like predicted nucleotidyltransferase (UPF0157 family)